MDSFSLLVSDGAAFIPFPVNQELGFVFVFVLDFFFSLCAHPDVRASSFEKH